MKKAFLYHERYFLLPDGISDVDELLALYDGSEIELWECTERKCLAPYFVSEFMVISKVLLGEGEMYPCEVEILPMLEYNRRLRARIEGYCDGCPNYTALTESETSLQGHHEEMLLDGNCFLRQKTVDDTADFGLLVDWFVQDFTLLGLEELIDLGKTDEATAEFEKAFAEHIFGPTPAVILTKAPDGRYGCYFIGLFDDNDSLIKEYIVDELDNRYGKTWDFQHFLPQGVTTGESVAPAGVSFERAEGDRASLNVTIFVGDENPMRAYLYLCELIGEDRFHTACSSLASQSGTSENMQTADALALEIDTVLEEYDPKEIMLPAVRAAANFENGEGEPPSVMINYRSDSLMFGFTVPAKESAPVLNVWNCDDIISMFALEIATMRFKLPFDPMLCEDPEQFECFLDEVDGVCAYLGDSMCAKCYGQVYDSAEYNVNLIVISMPRLMYKLHYLAPMLSRYGAELDVYTKDGKHGGRFMLDYSMQRIVSERDLWRREFQA